MRYGLLFSDVAAVLLGLIGLAGLASFSVFVNWTIAYELGRLHLFAGLAVILAGVTLVYLYPPLHQRILRSTFPVVPRAIFASLSFAWLTLSLGYLRHFGRSDMPLSGTLEEYFGWVMGAAYVALALLIFPFGIGYGELRAEHRARRKAEALDRLNAQIAEQMAIQQRPGETGARPGAAPVERGPGARVASFAGLLGLAYCGYVYLFGTVSQTLHLDGVLDAYALPTIAGGSMLGWAWVFADRKSVMARAHAQGNGTWKTAISLIAGMPVMAVTAYLAVGYYAFPYTWNALTENPQVVKPYLVTGISTGRRSKGCLTLAYMEQPDRTTRMCLGRQFGLSRSEGEILLIEGELSRFGHSMERTRVLRNE
ncbi:hypothetical protein [Jannaschia sp. W003]|uniref:hypothetical protein n=1 Tax=Jannaschia sp. W003 TaxID=2867012 RepID=UPI0021A3E67D|nr:hypothetical protein [Jannaschia sp. W003]UWQ21805.1 hypothetical protein K3554_01895 [Jannaschia sp. W003]